MMQLHYCTISVPILAVSSDLPLHCGYTKELLWGKSGDNCKLSVSFAVSLSNGVFSAASHNINGYVKRVKPIWHDPFIWIQLVGFGKLDRVIVKCWILPAWIRDHFNLSKFLNIFKIKLMLPYNDLYHIHLKG